MAGIRQSSKINVIYKNGVKDSISPALLNILLTSKQVAQFERSCGWVTVGKDVVRGMGGAFSGVDRRRG
jgi:hypothetical protein